MSCGEMTETLRDVMRAQQVSSIASAYCSRRNRLTLPQEEQGLLGDVRYIIGVMKSLSHTRDTRIRQLAQAHFDKIQQLKREQAYNMARLRTEKDHEIEVIRQNMMVSEISMCHNHANADQQCPQKRVEQSNNQAQKHHEAVLQLKQSNAYKINMVKTQKERELAAVRTELTVSFQRRLNRLGSVMLSIPRQRMKR